jgi:hypothetical protein
MEFPLSLEKSINEHVLTLFRSKKHFPCQVDFGPGCEAKLSIGSFNSVERFTIMRWCHEMKMWGAGQM